MWKTKELSFCTAHELLNPEGDDYYITDSPKESRPVMAEVYNANGSYEKLYTGSSVTRAKKMCDIHRRSGHVLVAQDTELLGRCPCGSELDALIDPLSGIHGGAFVLCYELEHEGNIVESDDDYSVVWGVQ